jgi:hypothetical protein
MDRRKSLGVGCCNISSGTSVKQRLELSKIAYRLKEINSFRLFFAGDFFCAYQPIAFGNHVAIDGKENTSATAIT